jgi:glycosyltransferase involved in cell wall biosynthesis
VAKQKQADRFLVFGAIYAFICLPARVLMKASVILFIRSLVFRINRLTHKASYLCYASDALERVGLMTADRIVAMSQQMAQELKTFARIKTSIAILPNDVPDKLHFPEYDSLTMVPIRRLHQESKKLLVISGVFDRRKNLMLTLEAIKILNSAQPDHNFVLIVAGDGPELSHARDFVACEKLPNVHFCGWVESLSPLYALSSLVIHPALHEGMPNSVLEAWGQGVPTLLAETAELCEMAPEKELWISPEDADDLAQKLEHLFLNPAEFKHLADLCQRCADRFRFDWDHSAVALVTE